MAAARAGALGVRWLQRAGWNVVPLGTRTASNMTKDMLPGPYPRTPEERAAAAKKYNMRVEDYEPYPDDGMGYGDYPKLPDRSQHERDPWYDWDHSDLRLNWDTDKPIFKFRKKGKVTRITKPTLKNKDSDCLVLRFTIKLQ
uniref:NADH dehydrogenase [ubiquinone] 1 beta subcomplex subunit 8, mitochondrial n=1 Tax=Microcebus murinus TaxID=30608 RepID=A0A8C5YJL5_MICMU